MVSKMCFPPHIGLPFDYKSPTVNGHAEWEVGLPLKAPDTVETGWTESVRQTYGGASGIPVVSFQALKHNTQNLIYLSWVVRLDLSYDNNDAIILVLQPSHSSVTHSASTRRIIIRPNIKDIGAGMLGVGDPGAVDFLETFSGPTGTISVPVRTNHPANMTVGRYDPGTNKWVEYLSGSIGSLALKVRSWTMSNADRCWSAELQLPTTTALGGANWIDLNLANFGLYFNVLRFGTPGAVVGFETATEYSWPVGHVISDASGGPYASLEEIMIPPGAMGEAMSGTGCQGVAFTKPWGSIGVKVGANVTGVVDDVADNLFVAELKNDGATDAIDVVGTFRLANFGIASSTFTAWAPIPVTGGSNPTAKKTVSAGSTGTELSMNWKLSASDKATYLGHGSDQCLWVVLDSSAGVMFKESSHRENISFKNLSDVEAEVVVSGVDQGKTPDGGPNHDFLIVTTQRVLSSTVDYDGWKARPPGSKEGGLALRDIPVRNADNAELFDRERGRDDADNDHSGQTVPWLAQQIYGEWAKNSDVNYTWIAITMAYSRSGETLTLGSTSYPLYNVIDSFSHVLTHQGDDVRGFQQTLDGPGLLQIGEGAYTLLVPDGDEVVLKVRYTTDGPKDPTVLDKLEQIGDTIETAAQRLKGQVIATHTALERIFDPDEKKD